MLKVLNQLHIKGGDPSVFLQHLIKELRNLLLLKLTSPNSTSHLIPLSQKEKIKLLDWIQPISSEDLHLLLDMALKGSWEITRVQDTKVFLEMLLLKMSQAPYIESLFGENPMSHKGNNKPNPLKESTKTVNKIEEKNTQISKEKQVQQSKSKMKKTDVQEHHLIQEIQNIFSADILDSKDL